MQVTNLVLLPFFLCFANCSGLFVIFNIAERLKRWIKIYSIPTPQKKKKYYATGNCLSWLRRYQKNNKESYTIGEGRVAETLTLAYQWSQGQDRVIFFLGPYVRVWGPYIKKYLVSHPTNWRGGQIPNAPKVYNPTKKWVKNKIEVLKRSLPAKIDWVTEGMSAHSGWGKWLDPPRKCHQK